MRRRQTVPRQWLIVMADEDVSSAARLPRGSGVLLLACLSAGAQRRLRSLARLRDLRVASDESAARVHNLGELRRALLARTPLVLLSPSTRRRRILDGCRFRACAPQRWRAWPSDSCLRWVG